jgi:hypothetical protein
MLAVKLDEKDYSIRRPDGWPAPGLAVGGGRNAMLKLAPIRRPFSRVLHGNW